MDKVYTAWFSINGEDRYIYIPESEVKYWEGLEGFDIRDESCICLEKEEAYWCAHKGFDNCEHVEYLQSRHFVI